MFDVLSAASVSTAFRQRSCRAPPVRKYAPARLRDNLHVPVRYSGGGFVHTRSLSRGMALHIGGTAMQRRAKSSSNTQPRIGDGTINGLQSTFRIE